jgi:1-acyl-sn-glycerol-3-phosphate acyltransferase
MIRTAWTGLVIVLATAWYGAIAIAASLLGVRGGIYVWATRSWSRTILRASGCSVRTEGTEHLLLGAPQIIASNHISAFDIFALAAVLPIPFHFVAKKELERIWLFGRAWQAAGHISIDRSDRRLALQSLRQAGEKIRQEKSAAIIFPEGTRSRSGDLQPFKKGAFLLASEAGVPVIPTAVSGSFEIMPPNSWWVRPREILVRFGAPVSPTGPAEELLDAVHQQVGGLLAEAGPPPS